MSFYHVRKGIRKLPGMVIKTAHVPEPEVTEGFGSCSQVGAICREMGFSSVLLVTDETLYGLGFHEKVVSSLKEANVPCSVFKDIASEPDLNIIEAGRKAAVEHHADCIVALGGGSVLDSSKIIAACAKHPMFNVRHYLHKFAIVAGKTLPMVTIPSTAGTGAEYTVGAVVKNAHGVKNSTVVIGLNVIHVILDSELMIHAPSGVTVNCGIDALSHGLEGLLADVRSTDEDIRKSRECVRLAMENLPILVGDPGNVEARQNMCRSAHYGGNAINKQLAGYVHAFAHSIGALYHIPHGEAIARCIHPVIEAQMELCTEPLYELAVYCGYASAEDDHKAAAAAFMGELKKLLELCGITGGCDKLEEKDYDKLISMIDNDSINYSPPKTFTDGEIRETLKAIKRGA